MNYTLFLALTSLTASCAYIGVFVTLHLLPTGYNPIRQAVSDYAVGKYGHWFRRSLWLSSIGVLSLAAGLALGVGVPPLAGQGLIYLALGAATRLGMILFPTDLEDQRLTRVGIIHYVFAVLTFTFIYMAISNITPVLVTLHPWSLLRGLFTPLVTVVAAALALVVLTMLRPFRPVFGLCERLFLASTYVWLILTAVLLCVQAY